MGEARKQALRIGSLLFCPACGTLLDLPKDEQDEIECHSCGRREPASCRFPPPSHEREEKLTF
jgi:DNA-directed RNA polymerase I subunit RPA12